MYHAEDLLKTRDALQKHQVEYMFIGKGSAIIQGFPDTTQDIDIYPQNEPENNRRLVSALKELEFRLGGPIEAEILEGKDFIQLRDPFDMDLVFAPDGFASYAEARKYKLVREGCPVMSIDGILISKRAAGRIKDRETMTRLRGFKDYLDAEKRRG